MVATKSPLAASLDRILERMIIPAPSFLALFTRGCTWPIDDIGGEGGAVENGIWARRHRRAQGAGGGIDGVRRDGVLIRHMGKYSRSHTREVPAELGYDEGRIAALKSRGII